MNAITALNQSFSPSFNAKDGLQQTESTYCCRFIIISLLIMKRYFIFFSKSTYFASLTISRIDARSFRHLLWVGNGGAKQVGKRFYSPDQIYQGDAIVFLHWLLYYEVLFIFTAHHWITQKSHLVGYLPENVKDMRAWRSDKESVTAIRGYLQGTDTQTGRANLLLTCYRL